MHKGRGMQMLMELLRCIDRRMPSKLGFSLITNGSPDSRQGKEFLASCRRDEPRLDPRREVS
jgi:hypothetical protein